MLDSSNSCSLLPTLYDECVPTFYKFMSFGLIRGYGFLMSLVRLTQREYIKNMDANVDTLPIISGGNWIKGSEIKVCYLNALMQNSLLNYTSEFHSYLNSFLRGQMILVIVELVIAFLIFIVYLQILLRQTEKLLMKSKKILGLFPVGVIGENNDTLFDLMKKIKL